jgi:hypothetical protein
MKLLEQRTLNVETKVNHMWKSKTENERRFRTSYSGSFQT